jgi:hypothetical protein
MMCFISLDHSLILLNMRILNSYMISVLDLDLEYSNLINQKITMIKMLLSMMKKMKYLKCTLLNLVKLVLDSMLCQSNKEIRTTK